MNKLLGRLLTSAICFVPKRGLAEKQFIGPAPFGCNSWCEQKYVSPELNYATVNLIEDRDWRFGPFGMWRFGIGFARGF